MRILIIFIFLISNSAANEITSIKNLVINKELKKYEDLTFFDSKKEQINLKDFKGKHNTKYMENMFFLAFGTSFF